MEVNWMAEGGWLSSYIEEITADTVKKIENAVDKAKAEFFPRQVKKVSEIYEDVIWDFYGDKSSRYYVPRGSLYNLFDCKTDGECLIMNFKPENFPSRTGYAGEDGLYQTVFREGWHGGAKHNGSLLYRTPYPYYTYWGSPAEHASISPLEDFRQRWYHYEDTEFEADLNKTINKYINMI